VLFNSLAFAVFFPIVFALYWLLRTPARQNRLLVLASLFFYGWWDWRFVSLILISTLVDYTCALKIGAARRRDQSGKGWLRLSLFANLGLLGVFKYFDFFIGSAESLWTAIGWRPDLLKVVLPVGISFYTFQTMSYTIDVYRGRFEARQSIVDVAAYVTFFPQLVAGPIERASTLIPQLEVARKLSPEALRLGLMLMLSGFLKKIVLADGIGPFANAIFQRAAEGEALGATEIYLGTFAFSLQLYGDFSGYSDIARGAARLLGIELMINFRQPYFSRSFSEVWQRWHISLSLWLRDYLYISLGGSREGRLKTLRNVLVTMLLGGLWHGAAWHFAVWGALVGGFIVVERLVSMSDPRGWSKWRQAWGVLFTYHLWLITLVFFRSDSVRTATRLLGSLGTSWRAPSRELLLAVALGLAVMVLVDLPHLLHPQEELPCATRARWRVLTLALAAIGFVLVPPIGSIEFIYFQF